MRLGLSSTAWNIGLSAWQARHAGAQCRHYESTGYAESADEEWCVQCTEDWGFATVSWSFYAFDRGMKECALYQLEARAPRDGSKTSRFPSQDLHRAVEDELTRLLGKGRSVDPCARITQGCSWWNDTIEWQLGELSAHLFIDTQFDAHPHHVRLIAQSAKLLAAARADLAMVGLDLYGRGSGPDLDAGSRASAALAPDYPEMQTDLEAKAARKLLVRLLRAAKKAPAGKRPLLLFGADALASRTGPSTKAPPVRQAASFEEVVEGVRLTWTWSSVREEWVHGHELLWAAWRDHPATEWGGEAYLALQREGWSKKGRCAEGSDLFRDVIRRGEEFLARQPSNPVRPEVEFGVAQSYETWWSLANASPDYLHAHAANYQDGATAARERAVAHYRAFVDAARARRPRDPSIVYAERRLARLELGFATGQRAYFCVSD